MNFVEGSRTHAIAALLALALASPALAQTPVRAITPDSVTIDNFGRVSAAYFRGSQPEGSDYADLAALGVKTVLNLIGDEDDIDRSEQASVERHGMRYAHIPMDTRIPPTEQQIEQFLSIVNSPDRQPVFVHCVGGKHRTGVMTAVYRMTNDGYTGEQAFKEMKQYKYGPDFLHPEFKKFVYKYQPTSAMTAAGASPQ